MKRKPKIISRTESLRQAGKFLIRSLLHGAKVKDGAATRWSPSYGSKSFNPSKVWVVFLQQRGDEISLRSSEVIAVCKRTGRVLYHGSANDEG